MRHNNKLNVCYFIAEDSVFMVHWMNLVQASLASGYKVLLITRVSKYQEAITKLGVTVLPLQIERGNIVNLFKEFNVLCTVYKQYRKHRPDIVHHFGIKPILYGTIVAKLTKVPAIVNTFAGLGWLFSNHWQAKVLNFFLSSFLYNLIRDTWLIVQNEQNFQMFKKANMRRLSIIRGTGVNIDKFNFNNRHTKNDLPVVILPARLLWDKGVGSFVEVARRLGDRGIQARFALVGKPDPENPSSISDQQLQEWSDNKIVEVWGHSDDMPEVYAKASIVCLPTRYNEGLPTVLMEAMACGLPVITTDMPGCREVVQHDKNGLLVPCDNPDALENAVIRLINEPNTREEFGKYGRGLIVSQFSSEIINQQFLKLYDVVCT